MQIYKYLTTRRHSIVQEGGTN
uniref:Uncharacterized protein n=1 Tax=Anguilla anguilla TaxID=7936 RepID=A0A0E9R6H1_ANGAN